MREPKRTRQGTSTAGSRVRLRQAPVRGISLAAVTGMRVVAAVLAALLAGLLVGGASAAAQEPPRASASAATLSMRVLGVGQQALLRSGRLRVRVRTTRTSRVRLAATAQTGTGRPVTLARGRTVRVRRTRTVALRLTRAGRRAVASCSVTRLAVVARSTRLRARLPRTPAFTGATRRVRRTVLRNSSACRGATGGGPTAIRAGSASADLTPPIGTPMFAYTARSGLANPENTPSLGLQVLADPDSGLYAKSFVASRGIHTRVRARAIVLETPAGKFALVHADLGGLPYAMTQAVLQRIADTGVRADRLLISATHTHSSTGPIWPGGSQGYAALGGDLFDARVFALTADGIAEAIRAANDRLAPARVGIGSAEVRDASRNRNTDPFARNADVPTDPAARKAVSINPALSVIRVDAADGRPLGVWSNFAVHTTSFGDENLLFSGDNAAFTERIVESAIRRDAVARGAPPTGDVVNVWTNGAEGDISPNGDADHPGDDVGDPPVPEAHASQEERDPLQYVANSFGKAHLTGERVARGVLRAWEDAGRRMQGTLAIDSRRVFLAFDGTPADGEPVGPIAVLGGGIVQDGFCSPFDNAAGPGQGRKFPGLAGAELVPNVGPVSVWRIGSLALSAFSAEVTQQMGRRIGQAVLANAGDGVDRHALVGLTNAYQSYAATPEEYDACHYEGSFTLWGRRQGPRLRDVAVALTRSLFGAPPPPSAGEPPAQPLPQPPAPGPGPTPDAGTVVEQPAETVGRFGRATFRWRGGNPQVDAPRGRTFVSLQRRTGAGGFETVATDDSFRDTVERDENDVWTERFQFSECSPEGTYRFRVTGQADRGGGPAPYEVVSRPFRVERLTTLKADAPVVDVTDVSVRALYPDPGEDALLALPRRVRSGTVLLEVRAPGQRPRRVKAHPDASGTFTATVWPGASVDVVEVRDACGNAGR